jgi:hypothetical protein
MGVVNGGLGIWKGCKLWMLVGRWGEKRCREREGRAEKMKECFRFFAFVLSGTGFKSRHYHDFCTSFPVRVLYPSASRGPQLGQVRRCIRAEGRASGKLPHRTFLIRCIISPLLGVSYLNQAVLKEVLHLFDMR